MIWYKYSRDRQMFLNLKFNYDFFLDVQNFAFTNTINGIDESFIYTGEIKNGVPNGQGKGVYYEYTYPATYEGSWKDGLPNGYGEIINSNGVSYKGSWKDSFTTQNGTFQFGTYR